MRWIICVRCCILHAFLFLVLLPPVRCNNFIPLTKDFLDRLDNETVYNRFATPTQYEVRATIVKVSMFIEGISSFRAQTMDFHIDMYFQQEWVDMRLTHNATQPILIRDTKVFQKLWHPDVYFANARSASFQHVTEDNFLVWVYPNGTVWYDCRISADIMCDMDLWKFPLDKQQCDIRILSYAYPDTQMTLEWSERVLPIEVNQAIKMPDMKLENYSIAYCSGQYATGNWSCLAAVFNVARQKMHHITQTYIPTALIVVISWFNFWLDVDSAPARVSLSITTLLTISTQANTVRLALPEVSYMKAIDVWMGSCMAFVFGVMIEFTICHFAKNQELIRRDKNGPSTLIVDSALSTLFGAVRDVDELTDEDVMRTNREQVALNILHGENHSSEPRLRGIEEVERNGTKYFVGHDRLRRVRSKPSFGRLRQQVTSWRKSTVAASRRALTWTKTLKNLRGRRVAQKIDERCRILFPLVFIIFNLLYWSYYLILHAE